MRASLEKSAKQSLASKSKRSVRQCMFLFSVCTPLCLTLLASPADAQTTYRGNQARDLRPVTVPPPAERLPNLAPQGVSASQRAYDSSLPPGAAAIQQDAMETGRYPTAAMQPNVWEMPPGTAIWGLPPQSPHRVIRQPALLSHRELKERGHCEKLHPPVATIQRAAVEPTWRQPYAYGYFGAQRHGHWQRHFGWNRSFTQWTFK